MNDQQDLFPEIPASTAIYKNRQRDKEELENTLKLSEFGCNSTRFHTVKGSLFAIGYERIVYGDHGPYLEFTKSQVVCDLQPVFDGPLPAGAYYEWLRPSDGSKTKVYDQKRDVKDLKNPPKGGSGGNRKEGYADYKPGYIYVNPYELIVRN